MAHDEPEVEWFFDPSTYFAEYGLLSLGGKWAAVKAKEPNVPGVNDYVVITGWVDDRKTAVGFLKLLKEK